MPIYRSAGVRITLETSDIALSTASKIEDWNSTKAREKIDNASLVLESGRTLNEQPISVDGRSFMAFLGAKRDMPFFLAYVNGETSDEPFPRPHVKAHGNAAEIKYKDCPSGALKEVSANPSLSSRSSVHNSSTTMACDSRKERQRIHFKSGKTARITIKETNSLATPLRKTEQREQSCSISPHTLKASSSPVPDHMNNELLTQPGHESSPKALTLTVRLDPNSLVWYTATRSTPFDIKIEVFYNGEFAACSLVTSKYRNSAKEELTRRFSGKRTHKVAEHAWTLDFGEAFSKPNRKDINSSRWLAIGRMHQKEASLRGVNQSNQRPPTGQFLAGLSQLDMPQTLRAICNTSTRRMAVIDVVLSLGKGRKFTSNSYYLSQPTRLSDPNYNDINAKTCSESGACECGAVKASNRQECREMDDSRLPDQTIAPAIAWSRAVSLVDESHLKTESNYASVGTVCVDDIREGILPAIAVSENGSAHTCATDDQFPNFDQRPDQAEVQMDGFPCQIISSKSILRKKPVQGSGPAGKTFSHDAISSDPKSSRIRKPLKRRPRKAKSIESIKRPKARTPLYPNHSAKSRTEFCSSKCHVQTESSFAKITESPLSLSNDRDRSPVSLIRKYSASSGDLSRRELRSGPPRNYAESSSSSKSITNPDELGFTDSGTSSEPPNMNDEAVASYAKYEGWLDSKQNEQGGPLRQIKQEKNGEFKEDSILVGVRFVLM